MKQISEKEAQLKLSSLCAQGEHCTQELIDKLNKWEISEEAQARIMEYLTKNKFVDDARFCAAFVKDKIKYNGWGRKKVEQALYIKRIPRSISDNDPSLKLSDWKDWILFGFLSVLHPI